ncbi:conserved hypothetical pox protein [Squirrelpox virus]|uniref:Conserved hypothetical pox protein n=1 Tax=Squirrelpox virus TaxID=240426 RepID=U3UBA6_9POXV|nr:conserved hypothetical pox protein [Squirrelpox virus]CCD83277.1 conserved hypothetical pox protein [Squirrelpox virus]
MERLRELYTEFHRISKEFLERESGLFTDPVDFDTDVDTLMSMVPVLESKVCAIAPCMNCDSVVRLMRHCDYQVFSFWFLRSNAVVKSVYNHLNEKEREHFANVFRDMLLATQKIRALNTMYNNIRQDTADIVEDSKKLMELISHVRSLGGDGRTLNLLNANFAFIVRTINKILSDPNYLLKLVAVFDSKLLESREKLEEYRGLFTISTESVKFGVRCVSDLNIRSIPFETNKYTSFLRRVLSNVILFQDGDLSPSRFTVAVYKLYMLVLGQLRTNASVSEIVSEVVGSVKEQVSPDAFKNRGVRNVQSLVKHISENKGEYRRIIADEYNKREGTILDALQRIADENGVYHDGSKLDVRALVLAAYENFFSKF